MKYLMTFSYDGSKFFGYQKQPDKTSVQEVIESKLAQINSNNDVVISASGRTDAGVHAINQKAHFTLDSEIEPSRLKHSLNEMLPPSIYIKDIKVVDDNFHARFNVKEKIYQYKINVGEYNPIEAEYIYQYCKELDVNKMIEASKHLLGEHNFKSFTKPSSEEKSYIRKIYDIDIKKDKDIIYLTFKGNGFMRYMVRNLVGTLIEVGSGKITSDDVARIINAEDRRDAGICAPACGLYLYDVIY